MLFSLGNADLYLAFSCQNVFDIRTRENKILICDVAHKCFSARGKNNRFVEVSKKEGWIK